MCGFSTSSLKGMDRLLGNLKGDASNYKGSLTGLINLTLPLMVLEKHPSLLTIRMLINGRGKMGERVCLCCKMHIGRGIKQALLLLLLLMLSEFSPSE